MIYASLQKYIGEMGRQEPHEVQQKVHSPIPETPQPHASVHAGGHPGQKQLDRKGPWLLVDTKLNICKQCALMGKKTQPKQPTASWAA